VAQPRKLRRQLCLWQPGKTHTLQTVAMVALLPQTLLLVLRCCCVQFLDGAADTGTAATAAAAAPSPEQIAAAEEQVVQQADAVRQLKGLGLGNSHPEVQSQVQVRSTNVA
jgi:hypothetical protein